MIERYQLIQNLVWSGSYTWEGAQKFADQADLSKLDPDFPIGPDGQGCVERPAKYGHGAIPHLFDHIDGIPSRLDRYIQRHERIARRHNGERTGTAQAADFCPLGVARICRKLIDEIERSQASSRGGKGRPKDGGAKAKNWCYALHVYCCNRGHRPTPELLHLTFRVLNCTRLAPCAELREDLYITPSIKKRPEFLQAIDKDAEHWARYGRQCPYEKLGDLVGVSGKQIHESWRHEAEYIHRLRFAISNWLNALERSGEETARGLIDFADLARQDATAQVADIGKEHDAGKERDDFQDFFVEYKSMK